MPTNQRSTASKPKIVFQFRISLIGISPEIWRRIVVPEKYSFWDLHVAIQDAMGWLDCHLHVFDMAGTGHPEIRIGIPDEDFEDDIVAGWNIGIAKYFTRPGQAASYLYDFGDSWYHHIVLEGILLRDSPGRYPRCLAGERACPPEDCGSKRGYQSMLEILADPWHEEFQSMNGWLKGYGKNYFPFNPDKFVPSDVDFSNPKARWNYAFNPED